MGVPDTQAAEKHPRLVTSYALREVGADLEAGWDVVSDREPVLGQQGTAVTDALATAGRSG